MFSPALLSAARAAAPIIRRMLADGTIRLVRAQVSHSSSAYVRKTGGAYGRVVRIARAMLDSSGGAFTSFAEISRIAAQHGVRPESLKEALRDERERRGLPTRRPGRGYRTHQAA